MTDELEKEPPAPATNGLHDVVTARLVVLSLGLTAIFSGISVTILQVMGKESPQAIGCIGTTAIGALAACLQSIMRPNKG